ncbi:hypothetical protein K1719_046631 [Acacia pycnantha]|nr:hypothetical protein K1719_046631 [Acacia pycnantha]
MDESDRPLYRGCQKYSKLSFLIKLYHIKCLCGITDKAMLMLLELLRDAFPDIDFPKTLYEAKKYTLFTKQSLLAQLTTNECILLRGFLGN